jgi:prolyl oligopeptidase
MITQHRSATVVVLSLLFSTLLALGQQSAPPTPKHPVTNAYWGTAVVDDYQWLENFDDPAVKEWNAAQNQFTRAYLDKLPERQKIADRLKQLYSKTSASYYGLQYRPGIYFAMKFKPPAQQPWIVTLKSLDDLQSEHVVLDPNKLNPKGTTAIDFAVPSHDGKKIAVCFSENGSEDGTVFIYDVASGDPLPDRIPRVQYPTGGGSVAWNSDDTGLYYTRYPHSGERSAEDINFYQQIYFHRLGSQLESDSYELGKNFPRIAEIDLHSRRDGKYLLATVANGDGGDYAHYLLPLTGDKRQWIQLTKFTDQIKGIDFGRDEALYVLSRDNAPRGKILRVPLDSLLSNAKDGHSFISTLAATKLIVPESDAVIQGYAPSVNGVYVQDLVGGPSQIRYFDLKNETHKTIPIKPVSAVQQILSPEGDELLFQNITYIGPFVWMKYEPTSGQSKPTALKGTSPADFSDMEVVREFATSKDGTKIPMNIIRRKGTKLDHNNPTLLYGYGGYGVSLSPNFVFTRRVWFDHGGVYVIANLRGGGEFGEQWHKSGNLTKKQNVFDDFAACAEYLLKTGYTRHDKLAVEGASNGGLLMGAFLTQHPDLVRAVVARVGIYDSLRTELEPNGAFNVTEFGTVKDQAQFRALFAYSPYHHVTNGVNYPAVMLLTGDHDGRVNPYNSRKMVARLQTANGSKHLILLRTSSKAGHGIGTALDERIAEQADIYAFLFDQLGMK